MKQFISSSIAITLLLASTAFANNETTRQNYTRGENQIVVLSDLSASTIEDLFSKKNPNFVLECTRGSFLPFTLKVSGEFLSLETEASYQTIEVLKTCYVKREKDTFFFSSDLENWKNFPEFFTGNLDVSLKNEGGTPTLGINLELNKRI